MQIHEITQRRKLSEAGFGAGLATGLTSALSKVGVAAPDASAYQQSSGANDELAAFKANAALVSTMMGTMSKAWAQTVAKYMAQSKDSTTGAPVTDIKLLDEPTKNILKQELYKMVNGAIYPRGDYDYNKLGDTTVDTDSIEQADIIKTAITKSLLQIWEQTTKGVKGEALTPLWQALVRDGIAPAQNFLTFTSRGNADIRKNESTGKLEIKLPGKPSWEIFNYQDPQHVKVGKENGWIQ
jgi:hypothetical protein